MRIAEISFLRLFVVANFFYFSIITSSFLLALVSKGALESFTGDMAWNYVSSPVLLFGYVLVLVVFFAMSLLNHIFKRR
ncbi:hypothetical protein AWR36_013395 [Microbulbifer flavimaris]|uniref:Uncharacterized protein n=1 Tax=Microbulbifer flavimaris TaxID=1781068 RepID=A0ABX4HWH5_9GAMM|nr:hypothetical protein AVO43_13370 [Microbulbifer sp. ZGT114]PCO04447.1 hypothetical protein AWR36_013395 [Microbulbifer flavimaris]